MKTIQSIQKYLLASILISFGSNIQKANAYLLIPDIDYFGGDMYSIYDVNSSLVCMNYCETIRDCRLATWCDNTCYVKNIKTNETQKLGCVTIDMYPDINSLDGSENESISVEDIQYTDSEDKLDNENSEESKQSIDTTNTPVVTNVSGRIQHLPLSVAGLTIIAIIVLSIF
jgi:hypothetical protein